MRAGTVGLFGVLMLWTAAAEAYTLDVQELIHEIEGGNPNSSQFGESFARLGDVDGDGVGDIALGEPLFSDPPGSADGLVVVYSGADLSVIYTLNSPQGGSRFGERLLGVPDLSGDGVRDLVVTAPAFDNIVAGVGNFFGAGAVYVYNGATGALINSTSIQSSNAGLGTRLHDVGRVSGTAHNVWVDRTNSFPFGASYVMNLPDLSIYETRPGALAVGVVADVNGDGHDEYLIGDGEYPPGGASNGKVWVYDGADPATDVVLFEQEGAVSPFSLGVSVVGLPDIDGDGFPEFAAGADDGDAVCIYDGCHAFSGSPGTCASLPVANVCPGDAYAELAGIDTEFGRQLALMPDGSGDGYEDLIVGVPTPLVFAGKARVFTLASDQIRLVATYDGVENGSQFGAFLSAAGDLNGDGLEDVWIAAPQETATHGTGVGRAYSVQLLCPEEGGEGRAEGAEAEVEMGGPPPAGGGGGGGPGPGGPPVPGPVTPNQCVL